jgi:hypothetical protein
MQVIIVYKLLYNSIYSNYVEFGVGFLRGMVYNYIHCIHHYDMPTLNSDYFRALIIFSLLYIACLFCSQMLFLL